MNGATIVSAADLVFQGAPVKLDASWSFADIGDYNGDGRPDILLRNTNGSFTDWTMAGATITAAENLTFNGDPVTLDNSWRTS